MFKGRGALVPKGAVKPLAVVEHFDVFEERRLGLLACGEVLLLRINQFNFQRAPERFHDGVVIAVGFAAHRGNSVGLFQGSSKVSTGVLDTAIGVEDQAFRRSSMAQRSVPSRSDQSCVDVLAHCPTDHFAAVTIQNAGQVEPTFGSRDVSDIRQPDLIGPVGSRQADQSIGRDGLLVATVGRAHAVTALLPPTNLFLAHEPADAIAPMTATQRAQAGLDARSAVGLSTVLVELTDLNFELSIFQEAPSRSAWSSHPVVIATGGDFKGLAKQPDGMLAFQGLDPLEALLGGSERIPKVFFKTSRWWRNRAFSRRKAASSASIWAWLAGAAGR